ncbi:MAG: ATP synthase F0 subunit A [Candidatus Kerfeldbacteria bacterium CG_4_10_14_0_8_um_filter_42_10]|uniref:ATP synthase subunit a n=1 Tax=Candidatus Kerfeldbacteria bacterium CG_4_10_14_0_8_um_filter_42_10 TaxID=2014248 RepID=A0A2M7RJL2_9BACT|nr:MAG: ATP synthase F0 subunit A [Candidatus Kerfeldbacteria bacterium CG_4_10_14_0_8_um_filter_42_10]
MATNEQTENTIPAAHQETDASDSNQQTETNNQVSHETTLYPEPILEIGKFTITNSLLNSWLAVLIIILGVLALRKKIKLIPRGLQNLWEIIIEGALKLADSVTSDRKKSMKIFPIVFAIFIFVLINNWLGLLPGVGSIGFIEQHGGTSTFAPFFRGSTADLNTTLGLALFAVIGSNIFGIITIGFWKHLNKFVNLKSFAEIPKKIRKEPFIVLINPIKAFVGIIELVGELAKIASLSFRLFGNIFAGEVLLAAMAVIFAFILPIPFIFLELIVGIVQALIFAMLTLVYFTIASTAEEH